MPIVLQFTISETEIGAGVPGMGISLDIDAERNASDHEIRLRRNILNAVNEVIWNDVEAAMRDGGSQADEVGKARSAFFDQGGMLTQCL